MVLHTSLESVSESGPTSVAIDAAAPAEMRSYEGLLFDMDGTLVDSTAAIEKHWQQ